MIISPFFSDYDDGYYYRTPSMYQQQQLRHAAAEEARRQAEIQRYRRMLEMEEQERLRQRQEYARRLRQRQLEEEAYEKELRRRQAIYQQQLAEEREMRRQEAIRAWKEQQGLQDDESDSDSESEEEEPVYQLFRGPNGRIYRVQVNGNPLGKKKNTKKGTGKGKKIQPQNTKATSVPILTPVHVDEPESENLDDMKTVKTKNVSKGKKQRDNSLHRAPKKRVTVIVEDASDSESEDLRSPCRNRRPSPGQWLEPVEGL